MAGRQEGVGNIRPDTSAQRSNGSFRPCDDGVRESTKRHVDDRQPDRIGMQPHFRAGDRVAMDVQKAGRWMKESSLAEKAVAVFLAIIMTLLFNLNREIGEVQSAQEAHINNHPNVALKEAQDDHERRLRILEGRSLPAPR